MHRKPRLHQAIAIGCILALTLIPQRLFAQGGDSTALAPHFRHLSSDDGLVQNSIQSITQDDQGYMWIATMAGLSRYDGYRFTSFEHDSADADSLSSSATRELFRDRDGMIWIGTEGGGADKFNPHTEKFQHFAPDPANPNTIGGDRIIGIFQDHSGGMWFGGGGLTDLSRLNTADQTFTKFTRGNGPNQYRGNAARSFVEIMPDQLWFTADSFLVNYDESAGTFTSYPIPNETLAAVVKADSRGNLWVGGSQALYQYNLQQRTFTPITAVRGINDMFFDSAGLLWIGTKNGLLRFDPAAGQIVGAYRHNSSQPDSLSGSEITALYQDRSGLLWIGTADAGLNTYDPRQARFAHYHNDPGNTSSLTPGTVNSIYGADKGHIWVGVENVLSLVNLQDGTVAAFIPSGVSGPLGTIHAILQDRTGIVWVGMNGSNLLRFDPATKQFSSVALSPLLPKPTRPPDSPGPSGPAGTGPAGPGTITALYEDNSGVLWVVNDVNGIFRLGPDRKDIQFIEGPHVPPPNGRPDLAAATPMLPIRDLYADREGFFWLSTINGLMRFDPRTRAYQRFPVRITEPGADSQIRAVHEDSAGVLWLAADDGLYALQPATGERKHYTTSDGLPSNSVIAILEDRSGNLWISTTRGLSKFTPGSKTFRNYDVADGLQSNEFSAHAYWQNPDGQLFFGGIDGVTAFYPEQVIDSAYDPPVLLTGFQLGNEPVKVGEKPLTQPIWESAQLTLNYDQDVISFEFAALSYAASSKNQYQYRLEGFDKGWTPASSSRRFVTYTNLPAGDYVFRVRATNNDGVWSTHEVALRLTILPPWWETPLFRIGLALALVALVLGGHQWRMVTIRRRNRLLEKEVTERTQALQERTQALQTSQEYLRQAKEAADAANRAKSAFLANMSHELRSPLNAILGFTQMMDRNETLSPEIHENLGIILRSGEHLLGLINQVLDLSKIEAGRMVLAPIDFDLYQLLDDIRDMFSLRATEKALNLIFDRTEDLPRYIQADEVKLRQILINLISNALKFTVEGGLTVRAKRDTRHGLPLPKVELLFEVQDTGPGIAPDELRDLFQAFSQTSSGIQAREGTGLGLPISRKFVQLMGGDITVASRVGHGSTFRFNILADVAETIQPAQQRNQHRVTGLEAGQPRYRILVTDDRWVNRQVLIKLLQPLGFDLREAQDGKEAVEIAQIFEPHLIWMDLRMTTMDGLEATRLIRATPKGKAMVIIALTASAFEEDRATVLAAGCDDFVRKPFRTEEIFDLLAHHLGVRFTYADDQPRSVAARPDAETLQAALASLPAALVSALKEGIELGDMDMIDEAIARIPAQHSALSETLKQLTYQFEYDKILDLLRKATP